MIKPVKVKYFVPFGLKSKFPDSSMKRYSGSGFVLLGISIACSDHFVGINEMVVDNFYLLYQFLSLLGRFRLGRLASFIVLSVFCTSMNAYLFFILFPVSIFEWVWPLTNLPNFVY